MKTCVPLVDVIAHICDALPQGLHEPVGHPRLTQVAAALPPFMTLAGLEFRLADNNPRVDIGIGYTQADAPGLAQFLADAVNTHPAFANNGWLQLLAFTKTWNIQPEAANIRYITVEIDVPAELPHAPVPMVSFFMDATHPFDGAKAAAAHILSIFQAHELQQAFTGRLWSCIDALHPSDTWRGIGLMTNRGSEGARMLLKMDAARVLPYLRKVDWYGPEDAVALGLETLRAINEQTLLYIDVGSEVGPRIGLGKLLLGEGRRFDGYSQKLTILDRLADSGLCSAQKALAFQALHKRPITSRHAIRPWPNALTAHTSDRKDTEIDSQLLHVVMAVKISYQGNLEPEAKLYSAISHHWLF